MKLSNFSHYSKNGKGQVICQFVPDTYCIDNYFYGAPQCGGLQHNYTRRGINFTACVRGAMLIAALMRLVLREREIIR